MPTLMAIASFASPNRLPTQQRPTRQRKPRRRTSNGARGRQELQSWAIHQSSPVRRCCSIECAPASTGCHMSSTPSNTAIASLLGSCRRSSRNSMTASRPAGQAGLVAGLRRVRSQKRAPSHPMHQLGRGQINNNAATALPPVVMIIIPMSVLPCRSRKVGGRSQLYRLTSYTRYPLSDAAHFEPLARIPLLPLRTRGGCRGVLANSSSA